MACKASRCGALRQFVPKADIETVLRLTAPFVNGSDGLQAKFEIVVRA